MRPCLFCGMQVELVQVHGHYQCPVCKTNALPCCDSDNCETNQLPQATDQFSEIKKDIGNTAAPEKFT